MSKTITGRMALMGIRRSFDIYYRDAARTARMDRLNGFFVRPGALVFDIGAHVGDRTGSFLRLGANVVTLEPQPVAFRALRCLYGRCERVSLLPLAAGSTPGQIDFYPNPANPTVSSATPQFIAAATGAPGWEGQSWQPPLSVSVTTLDALIAEHGVPDFVKIDVEGHEAEVLAGLSTALPLLSFEMTTVYRIAALASIDRLDQLGGYRFNASLGEEHALQFAEWLPPQAIRRWIEDLSHSANSGDIYARRV